MKEKFEAFEKYCEEHWEFVRSLAGKKPDEIIAAIKAAGFDFTYDEFKAHQDEARALSAKEMAAVSGGLGSREADCAEHKLCPYYRCRWNNQCPNYENCRLECPQQCGNYST